VISFSFKMNRVVVSSFRILAGVLGLIGLGLSKTNGMM